AQTFIFQLETVLAQSSLACFRDVDYQFARLFNHITIGLLVGLNFFQVSDGVASSQYQIFSIFIAGVLPILVITLFPVVYIIAQVKPFFIIARMIFLREAPSKTYIEQVFALAQFFGQVIWMVKMFAVTLGQAIAALSPSIFIASQINSPTSVMMNLFCGVIVPHAQMPKFGE
ncbi:hypothetical protein MJO28_010379, partial [Puccinia striiformis f. sp. tritici]